MKVNARGTVLRRIGSSQDLASSRGHRCTGACSQTEPARWKLDNGILQVSIYSGRPSVPRPSVLKPSVQRPGIRRPSDLSHRNWSTLTIRND